VYRTIDFLEAQGLVHKVHALNAYVPCHHPGKHKACQFLICDGCGDVKEFCDAELSALIPAKAKDLGFQPRASVVEVFGICGRCAPAIMQ
jgi:Fur family zinc uptake transcriptional regulator